MMGQLWGQKADTEAKTEDREADIKKAREWFDKAVAANPKSAKVNRIYSGWLLDQRLIDVAAAHIAEAAKLEPDARDTKVIRGLLARYKKDYAGATTTFEDLFSKNPADAQVLGNLALVLAEQGDPEKRKRAVMIAELYQKQNPQSADGAAVLGYCLFKDDRVEEAERVLNAAVSSGRAMPDTAYYLALVLNKRGKTDEAYRLLEKALESKGPFVNRQDAETLKAKIPAPKPADPKAATPPK